MKKLHIRIVCMLLCAIMLISPVVVRADATESGIISALRGVEDIKDELGLGYVNFNSNNL